MAVKRRKKRRTLKRKTTKANKKLMSVLGFSTAVLALGVGAAWFFLEYRGAQRNIRIGNELVAEGNYRDAAKQYGRAIRKEGSNLAYVKKWRDTLLLITPPTLTEARAFYKQYLSSIQHEARYSPRDIEPQLRIVEEMFHDAYITSDEAYWQQVAVAADSGLERISPDNPRRHELVLYRALATLHLDNATMTDRYDDEYNVRFPGEDDIEAVLESDPGNAVAWAALAHGRMAVYHRLRDQGRTQQADRSRIFADETMKNALEIASGGFEISVTKLREMLLRRVEILKKTINNTSPSLQAELDSVNAAVLESREIAVAAFDPIKHYYLIGEFVSLLMNTGLGSTELSIGVLRDYMESVPDDLDRQHMLVHLLKTQEKFDEAISIAQSILDRPQLQVGMFAIQQFEVRRRTAHVLVLLTLEKIATSDPEERENLIALAKQHREVLLGLVSQDDDNYYVNYSDGLIAMAEKRYKDAAFLLENLIRQYPNVGAQAYREAAIALSESGASGLAIERLAEALAKEPRNLSNYILKARLELMVSDFESALVTLNKLSTADKSRPAVQELLDLISLNQKEGETRFTDPVLALIAMSERATSLGEYEDSIAMLMNGIEKTDPPDWRLYAAISNVYIASQDLDEAAVWMRLAVEEEPDNKLLQNTLIGLESDDEVEAIIAIIKALDLEKAEEAELIAVRLFLRGMSKLAESNRWVEMGNAEEAAKAKSIGEHALVESKKHQAEAEAAGADMTKITLIRFDQSLVDLDVDLANELLKKLENLTDDQLELSGAQVRLFLAMAKKARKAGDQLGFDLHSNKALDIAKNMTAEVPFSDYAWEMLGLAHTAMQQHLEALPAFEQAWRIAPNKENNIRKYIASLTVTKADPQRRLRVIRSARERYPNNKQFLNVWLSTEQSFGDKWKVIDHHYEKYKIHPDDRENALQLAFLLVNTDPAREFIRNADGTEVYRLRTWNQLQSDKQEDAIRKLRELWDEAIVAIVEKAEKEDDPDVRTAHLHASIARDRGQLDTASEIWDRFIQSRKGTESFVEAVTTAADFLQRSGRADQAISILRMAKEQVPDRYELDGAIGSILYFGNDYESAADHLGIAVAASRDLIYQSRWVESLIYSGQFEKAELALVSFESTNTAYGKAMLRALISLVKSEQLLAKGDITGGTTELVAYRRSLKVAIRANPEYNVPYIRLAKSLLNEYRLTQNKKLLEEALQVADEGEKRIENSVDFAVIRADVLQADGQLHRGVDRLVRFLAQNPDAKVVRSRLIEAYLDMEEVDKAIKVASVGIESDPSDPTWYLQLGKLHLRAGDNRGEAVKVFITAFERNPSSQLLLQIDELTRTKEALPNRKLLSMARGPLSKLHPIRGAIEAKALLNLGSRREALLAMEKSWYKFEVAIESGWLPPTAFSSWFIDLRELYDDDPAAGEQMIHTLAGTQLSNHQLIGLATYWKAFGDEYIDKSIRILESAIKDAKANSDIHLQLLTMLGSYLVDAGKYEESAKTFLQLSEMYDSPVILNNLAYVVGVYLNRPAEGLVLAERAVKRMPRNPSFVDTIASLHDRSGDYQKAADTLEFLLQLDSANARAMAQLAVLYSEFLGQPERGVVFAERARSQTPRSPEVLDALGWSYYQNGRLATGEEYLLKSLKRGETMSTYLHLAQVVMARSEFDEALGHLRMAQELAQDDYSLNRISALQDDIRKAKSLADM